MGKNEIETRGADKVWPLGSPASGHFALAGALGAINGDKPREIELNLATLWRVVREWRWLILSAIVAGVAGAVIITLLTPPLYKSTAVLEINPPTVEVTDSSKSGSALPSDPTFLATQYGLLQSRSLAERVSQDLNLTSNQALVSPDLDRNERQKIVVNVLQKNLTITPTPDSSLVRVSYLSPDPSLAAKIVNGFADSFISTGLERRYEASSYARDFLQRQIGNVRRELETSERQLVAYAQRQHIIVTGSAGPTGNTNDSNSLTGESLQALNKALADVQTRRIRAEQAYRQALTAGATDEANARTQDLRSQRALLQAEYQDKLNLFQPDYPAMVQMRARIQGIDQAIAREDKDIRAGRSGSLKADYMAAVNEENELHQRVENLRQDVLNLRGRSIQYTILQREVDTNRTLYDALLQRFKEIGAAAGSGASLASIVDRGDVPTAPAKPNLLFNLIVGLFLGLACGIGAALIMEFISDTIKNPDDVRERLQLAFLGGIPASKGRKPIEDLRDPASPLSEAYFSSATALRFATEHGTPKSLLITSTRPAEGKSTTTWALAQHFARLGLSVLLVDGDLRKPAFVTGREKEDGLSTLLTSRDHLRPHVFQSDTDRLWLLPSGPLPPNPAELLTSARLQAIIDEATTEFDMVIVDGPPILGLADSPLLSLVCEGTLMVVEAGKTRTRAAVEALHRIQSAGRNVVGVILTRYRHESTGYGYNYEAYTYNSIEQSERQIRAITNNAA